MKKKIFVLSLLLLGCISCSSDSSSDVIEEPQGFTSTIVVDGLAFKPNNGVYTVKNETLIFDPVTKLSFTIKNIGSNQQDLGTLWINIMYPTSQKSITGEYSFGPGTSKDLLGNAELLRGDKRYGFVGYTINVTDLGNSRFRFEFIDPYAIVNGNLNEKVTVKGSIEGKFELK